MLSWKFWSGEEDYRWQVLRKDPMFDTRLKWLLFNLFHLSLPEHVDMVIYASSRNGCRKRQILNRVGFCPLHFCSCRNRHRIYCRSATVNYQKEKYRRLNAGEPLEGYYKNGFVSTPVWKYVRPKLFSRTNHLDIVLLF